MGAIDLPGLLAARHVHRERLSNRTGAHGESEVVAIHNRFLPRPKGADLARLLAALKETGITIKKSSFDAIAVPDGIEVDFTSPASLQAAVSLMTFIEIKTSTQERVGPNFENFLFSFPECEILAAEVLGDRHQVLLYNKLNGIHLFSTVPALLARARSKTWQLTTQL